MLWRALKHIKAGTYIDLGAQDPILDSVSKGFYLQGWRGVHIEPSDQYAEMLRLDRPDETIIHAAVTDKPGTIRFYEIPGTGLSTGADMNAETLGRRGWKVVETLVTAVTLDQILDGIRAPDIHWLKIDVEGFERSVMEGWRDSPRRPWIVVVEALSPMDLAPSHIPWEQLLIEKKYSFVYFDGLNRFYVSDAHPELKTHFDFGVSLWDDFQLPENRPPVQSLLQRHEIVLNELRVEAQAKLSEHREAITRVEAASAQVTAALSEATSTLAETRGELDRTRVELKSAQEKRDQALHGLRQTASELNRALDDRKEVIVELAAVRSALGGAHVEISELHAKIQTAQREMDRLAAASLRHRVRLSAELQAITESLWWRISAPFRKRPVGAPKLAASLAGTDDILRPAAAANIQELLSYFDEDFVHCAYATLLGRKPEPEGLQNYVALLQNNASRESVAVALATSPEGAKYAAESPGLDELVKRHQRRAERNPGRIIRKLLPFHFAPKSVQVPVDGAPPSIEALLSQQDEAFVRVAYAALLKREPDPGGMRHYLADIRKGEDPLAVVDNLRISPEGRLRKAHIRGLDAAVLRYRAHRLPLLGHLVRLASAPARRGTLRRKLTAVQTQLELISRSIAEPMDGAAELSMIAPAMRPALTAVALVRSPTSVEPAPTHHPAKQPAAAEPDRPAAEAAPLSWRIDAPNEHQQVWHVVHKEIAHALAELGHHIAETPSAVHRGVTALVGSFPLPAITNAGSTLLVGHDWGESGFPALWADAINATVAGVACASRHALKVLIDHGVEVPLAAVGLGVDHWDHIIAAQDFRAPGKEFRFLHVSSCGLEQGVDLLVEAFGRVFDSDDNVSLVINPSGAARYDISNRLEQLRHANPRFPDVVVIEAELNAAQLKALYEECHVFAAPSRAEGFGLPLALALVSGLPLVATAWGGHTDYCDETNCWLVDYTFERSTSAYDLAVSVWAEPIAAFLDAALWTAYRATPAERAAKARSGRIALLKRFRWVDVATRLADFARHILAKAA